MIVDTSALAAIAFREEGFEEILDLITLSDPPAGVPATVLAELGMVLSARLNMDPRSLISRLVEQCGLEVVPFGSHHWAADFEQVFQYARDQGWITTRFDLGIVSRWWFGLILGRHLVDDVLDDEQSELWTEIAIEAVEHIIYGTPLTS